MPETDRPKARTAFIPARLVAAFLAASALPLGTARAQPARTFATEIACEKRSEAGVSGCRRAFQVARALYESRTRSYSSRQSCYRAYGPCMPWPLGAGAGARFRPQWMGVSLVGSADATAALPVVAPGKVKLAFEPHLLSAAFTEAPMPAVETSGHPGRPSETAVTLCRQIVSIARKEKLPPGFLARLLWQESSFRARVVSPAGALGIAQFMPATAQERGLADPFDPAQAIQSSAALLADLARRFGNYGLAAAAYNGGPARVSGWLKGHRTLAPETEAYVLRITGRSAKAWAAGTDGGELTPERACLDVAAQH